LKKRSKLQELEKVADFITKYRRKIKDFNDTSDYYVYIDYERLNDDIKNWVVKITSIVNKELAGMFMATYEDVDEAIWLMEPVFEEIVRETEKIKGLYLDIEEYSKFDKKLNIYKRIILKLLNELEMFFINLENLLLRGGKGELKLEFDVSDEIMELKDMFHSEKLKKVGFGSFIIGLGLGWLIFGGDDGN